MWQEVDHPLEFQEDFREHWSARNPLKRHPLFLNVLRLTWWYFGFLFGRGTLSSSASQLCFIFIDLSLRSITIKNESDQHIAKCAVGRLIPEFQVHHSRACLWVAHTFDWTLYQTNAGNDLNMVPHM